MLVINAVLTMIHANVECDPHYDLYDSDKHSSHDGPDVYVAVKSAE